MVDVHRSRCLELSLASRLGGASFTEFFLTSYPEAAFPSLNVSRHVNFVELTCLRHLHRFHSCTLHFLPVLFFGVGTVSPPLARLWKSTCAVDSLAYERDEAHSQFLHPWRILLLDSSCQAPNVTPCTGYCTSYTLLAVLLSFTPTKSCKTRPMSDSAHARIQLTGQWSQAGCP